MHRQNLKVLGHCGYEVGSLMFEQRGCLPQDIVMIRLYGFVKAMGCRNVRYLEERQYLYFASIIQISLHNISMGS